jgi:GT2 family glycosyltransferase
MIPTYIVLAVHSREPYNTVPYLDECMRTLKEHTQNFRMIFVDDFCDEAGTAAVASHAAQFPDSYVVRTMKQRWFTRAYNLGLRLVRSPWAVLLNVDTVIGPGWLDELYAVRDEAESQGHRVGLVGSVFSAEEPRRWFVSQKPGFRDSPLLVSKYAGYV